MDIKTLLLTTDFSDTSLQAFPAAVELAEKFGSEVVLAFVEEDRLPPLVIEYAGIGTKEILAQQRDRAAVRLEDLARERLATVRHVRTVVREGTAHVEIARLASETGADLIVMATHGRGFFTHAIMGSTTERVIRGAPCPVFVVRGERARLARTA